MRKIVQICVSTPPDAESPDLLYALCDDSTIWIYHSQIQKWRVMTPIPKPDDEK